MTKQQFFWRSLKAKACRINLQTQCGKVIDSV
jgi:hypothetical protein